MTLCTISCDEISILLDADKEGLNRHRKMFEKELDTVGICINERPPNVKSRKKSIGGDIISYAVTITKLGVILKSSLRILKKK